MVLRLWVALTVMLVALGIDPLLSRADTVLLMSERGEASPILEELQSELNAEEGVEAVIAGTNLEDSALMLGCDPTEGSCLDTVIEMGGADGLLVVPKAGGTMVLRKDGGSTSVVAPKSFEIDPWKTSVFTLLGLMDSDPVVEGQAESDEVDPVNVAEEDLSGEEVEELDLAGGTRDRPSTRFRPKQRTWIVLGSGGAVTTLGLVFWAVASSKQTRVNGHPVETEEELQALQALEASGQNYNLAGNLFFLAGGAALAGGIGLLYLDIRDQRKESTVSLVPTAGPSMIGASLSWSTP